MKKIQFVTEFDTVYARGSRENVSDMVPGAATIGVQNTAMVRAYAAIERAVGVGPAVNTSLFHADWRFIDAMEVLQAVNAALSLAYCLTVWAVIMCRALNTLVFEADRRLSAAVSGICAGLTHPRHAGWAIDGAVAIEGALSDPNRGGLERRKL